MKISTKILLFVSAMIVLAVTAAVGMAMIENAAYVDKASVERAEAGLTDLQGSISEQLETANHSAVLLAGNAAVIDGIRKNDFNTLKTALDNLNNTLTLDTITATDAEGNVIIRQHDPEKKGDNIANQSNVQKAMAGGTQATIEAGTTVKLSCRAAAPVLDDNGSVLGTIVVGYTFENREAGGRVEAGAWHGFLYIPGQCASDHHADERWQP